MALSTIYLVDIELEDKQINEIFFFTWDKNMFVIDIGEIPRQN